MNPVPDNRAQNQRDQPDAVGDLGRKDQKGADRQEAHRDYYAGDVLDVRCPFCRRAAQLIIRNGHAKWLVEVE